MDEPSIRTVFRANAVLNLGFALLLLAGTWNGLYDALDLPQARPAIFAQFGGALGLGIAYLFWVAPEHERLTLHVARAGAIVNAILAVIVFLWLVAAETGVGTLGTILLVAILVVVAVFALLEARIASRPVAGGPGAERTAAPER